MTVDAELSYFDFAFSRWAYASGRGPTSRLVQSEDGVWFRRYGRNVHEYTLVTFDRPALVGPTLAKIRRRGDKLKSVNFTRPVPEGLATRRGPDEYRVPGSFDTFYADRSSKTRGTILRACRGAGVVPLSPGQLPVRPMVEAVFSGWLAWAKGRHFMVFKGHYERWLQMWFEEASKADDKEAFLYLIVRDGSPVGIFGGEVDGATREAQVTIAKHLPDLSAKALWTLGLRAVLTYHKPSLVHCGSTADVLKLSLGFEPTPSWVPDLKAIA